MILQEPVQAAIWHCLNHYDQMDAIFLAERLCTEVENDETVFLLATSYFRTNMINQAYWLLKEKSRLSPQCRFLLAKCAYQLHKFGEAESALSSISIGSLKNFDQISKEFGEIACFALQLIGQICAQTERHNLAVAAYKRALKLNPFLWNAFADLCNLGEKVDPNSVFQFSNTETFNTCQGNNNISSMIIFGSDESGISNLGPNGNLYTRSDIITNAPILTKSSSGIDIMNTSCNNINANYILTTPIDQSNNIMLNNHQTPNNNLNNSLIILRGNNCSNNIQNKTADDIPHMFSKNFIEPKNLNSFDTPYRRQFKYLSAISPSTPSFGVLPISPNDSSFTGLRLSLNSTNSPSPQTLVEVNQEQKVVKKLKSHIGGIMNRKDNTHHIQKPAVFTQTGNITPRTPNSCTAQNVRRSSRLFGSSSYSVKENNKSPNMTKFAQPRSPPRKTKQRISNKLGMNNQNEKDKKDKEKIEAITATVNDSKVMLNNSLNSAQTIAHHVLTLKRQSAEGLMSLLRDIGQSYQHLAQYNCKEAIECFETIPKHHFLSSWVQSLIGLANYELREYDEAVAIFKRVHENDPYRLDFMEIYSSSLWHLQKEVDLSSLAQDLMANNKNSAVTWCVAGNCFSLHKEHETAIKFFKRAVQVDPDFVYSYTLLGHELVLTEELDKALNYFRTAVMKDFRHYNAWFGIGTIYSKQEKYLLAELHYRQALKINPKNSVILVHIGAMQYFMSKKELALQTLNAAALVDPKNPLARFHRGSIYFSLGKHKEALSELEDLKEIVPKESVVFYLIGKIHKTLGNIDSALMHFSWATDLDPKGANNQMKDAFDSMSYPSTPTTPGCTNVTAINNEQSITPPVTTPTPPPTTITTTATIETEIEPVSEQSDESVIFQQAIELDINYDSDSFT